ncbi:4'-phosphopantetheinyl transferase family protein [Streptomyces sp. WM6378]|uniref:4'-phosphopantetheinyl transferase family protein n=1 Tax=Streptomyces sp. WM6378 TaxID=1415557 RepID=UPI0006ADC319|nr:4'-phosphopantetheinyl transferase superfamily protein [Streptomyces sp. WM6378]
MTRATRPPRDTVHVWRIPLTAPPPLLARLSAVLDAEERRRGAAAAFVDTRRRHTVSHGAMRHILGHYLDRPPKDLIFRHGDWGKPELAGHEELRFSLSHCDDLALLAVTAGRDVGVDVERVHGDDRTRLADRHFPPDEAAWVRAAGGGRAEAAARFARLWTRKEAWVKAAGGRLLENFHLPVSGPDIGALQDPAGRLPGSWRLSGLPAPDGYAAALALAGARPFTAELKSWPGWTG